jgi:D-alanyl-D-alanine carboxypeptidase/D-alanyl-D-alanine-endopeptidase (penicillin-binding protein 4)
MISFSMAQVDQRHHPDTVIHIKDTLCSQIDQILSDSSLSSSFIGIKIVRMDNGSILYERNSNKLFHPASNLKLVTTAAALNILDKNFEFTTKYYTDGKADNGNLNGNLYIKGCGDPLLETSALDSISSHLRMNGITAIKGDIIGDVSYFDSVYWGEGWMWDDEPSTDEPFISPLCVNKNSVKIIIRPALRLNDPPIVTIEPLLSSVKVINYGLTTIDTSMEAISVFRLRGENKIIIHGRISPGSEPKEFSVSLRKPELIFLELLRDRINLQGIRTEGRIRLGTIRGRKLIYQSSHSLDSVIHIANKLSDNLAAENLLKTFSAELTGKPGISADGIQLTKHFLASLGIDTSKVMMADGSGVSWYNEMTPDGIVTLLIKLFNNKTIFQRFYESLPIAGIDGTMKNRMKNTRATGNLRAKTGSLRGVSGLSGYGTSIDNHMFAFSILCNHFPGNNGTLREIQDKILELLVNTHIGDQ